MGVWIDVVHKTNRLRINTILLILAKWYIEKEIFMEITKNKMVELPCFVGDKVYGIKFPTHSAAWNKEKPTITEMTVLKVSYEASNVRGELFEKIRIDVTYKNKLGDDSYDFYIWEHGELFNCLTEAEEKLNSL